MMNSLTLLRDRKDTYIVNPISINLLICFWFSVVNTKNPWHKVLKQSKLKIRDYF